MPWTMCWDPVCTVAEVWCCSEHYLWLWVAFWWRFLGWRHRLQCIVIVQSFLRLLKLHKLAVGKLDLSRGDLTYSVLHNRLNSPWNIPLTNRPNSTIKIFVLYHCLLGLGDNDPLSHFNLCGPFLSKAVQLHHQCQCLLITLIELMAFNAEL